MFLSDGQHYIEGGRVSPLRGVLYHFKYLQDFAPHVMEEIRRGEHWQGASEYQTYARILQSEGGRLHFRDENSLRFVNARQLEELGLMIRPADFDEARETPTTA